MPLKEKTRTLAGGFLHWCPIGSRRSGRGAAPFVRSCGSFRVSTEVTTTPLCLTIVRALNSGSAAKSHAMLLAGRAAVRKIASRVLQGGIAQ